MWDRLIQPAGRARRGGSPRLHGRQRAPAAFTLVELLVVIAIIGVLVALLLPAVQAAREAARLARCQNNLRQLGVALSSYEGQERSLPIGCIGCQFSPGRFHSWNAQLLPWLEQSTVAQQLDLETPSYKEPNRTIGAIVFDVFLCPSTLDRELVNSTGLWKGAAFTDYGGIFGVGGVGHDAVEESDTQRLADDSLGVLVYEEAVTVREIADGLSQTVAVAELHQRRGPECEWISGNNVFAQEGKTPINAYSEISVGIGSPHPGGAATLFCDGHVAFLDERLDQPLLNARLTRAAGDMIDGK